MDWGVLVSTGFGPWILTDRWEQEHLMAVEGCYRRGSLFSKSRRSFHFQLPPTPSSPFPPSLASSAVWSMGPGQVAKHVQPSLPLRFPPPFLSHPDGLLFSCAARHRFQPGQMFDTGDNMFAPRRCSSAEIRATSLQI